MNRFQNGLIVLLSAIILILGIAYKGEMTKNKQSKKQEKEFLRAIDSLGTDNRLHIWEASQAREKIRKSEAEKDRVYNATQKREAVLQSKIKNLTKEQAITIIPKDTLLAGQLILKGLEYDSLKKDYDQLAKLMQFREIEFKTIIINQDSLIMNLRYEVELRIKRELDLEDQIRQFRRQKRANAWGRNIAIVGIVAVILLK